jgi:hypothetical protein
LAVRQHCAVVVVEASLSQLAPSPPVLPCLSYTSTMAAPLRLSAIAGSPHLRMMASGARAFSAGACCARRSDESG